MSRGILHNTLYTLLSLIFVGSIRFVFNVAVARGFDPQVLGQANVALSAGLLVAGLLSTFFGQATVKFLAQYRGAGDTAAHRRVLRLALLGPIPFLILIETALWFARDALAARFELPGQLFAAACLFVVARTYYMILRQVLYGNDDVRAYTAIEIVADLGFFAVLGWLLWRGESAWLLLAFVAGYGLFIVLSLLRLRNARVKFEVAAAPTPPARVSRAFLSYSAIAGVGTVCSTAMPQIAVLLCGARVGAVQAGLFGAAISAVMVLMFVPVGLGLVLLPSFAEQHGRGGDGNVRATLNRTTHAMVLLAFLVVGAAALLPQLLMRLFGESYIGASVTLQLLLGGVLLQIVGRPAVMALSGTRFVLDSNLGGVLTLLGAFASWAILVPRFGIDGIAAGYTSGLLFGVGFILVRAKAKLGLELAGVGRRVSGQLALLAAAILANVASDSRYAVVVASVYLALLLAFNRAEIAGLLKPLRGGARATG